MDVPAEQFVEAAKEQEGTILALSALLTTTMTMMKSVIEALEAAGIETLSAEVSLVSETLVPVTDKAAAASIMRFVDALEDNDDVQSVYTNMDVDDAIMQELDDE